MQDDEGKIWENQGLGVVTDEDSLRGYESELELWTNMQVEIMDRENPRLGQPDGHSNWPLIRYGYWNTVFLPPKSPYDCYGYNGFPKLGLKHNLALNPRSGGVQIPDGHGIFIRISVPKFGESNTRAMVMEPSIS